MKLDNRIRQIRTAQRLTQGKMADRTGIAVSTYQYYERGERVPPADFLSRLITVFGVDPTWLLTGKGEIFPQSAEVAQKSSSYKAGPVEKGKKSIASLADDPELADIVAWLKADPRKKHLIHQLMKHEKGSRTILEKLLQ